LKSGMCDCACVALGEIEELVCAMQLEHRNVFLDRARKSRFKVNFCSARSCIVVLHRKDNPSSVHKKASFPST
jgi:hypothetical protein